MIKKTNCWLENHEQKGWNYAVRKYYSKIDSYGYQGFTDLPQLWDLTIFMAPHRWVDSMLLALWGPLCSSCQQAVWITVQIFQENVCLERLSCLFA